MHADTHTIQNATWETRLETVALTDVGLRRANNQDAHSVMFATSPENWRQRGHLFLVADGMGAHAAGELASKLAADNIPHTYSKFANHQPPTAIVKAVREVNRQINRRGHDNPDFQGMGTTTSALLLLPQGALVAHVGDSRVYRLRGDHTLEQLSFDHSYAWELAAHANLSESQIQGVPKNIITRSLGPSPEVDVDLEGPFPVEPGDVFLVCSDGLSGQVDDVEIGALLANLPPVQASHALLDLANLRGGPDNITLIVVRVREPLAATAPLEPLGPVVLDGPDTPPPQVGAEGWIAPVVGFLMCLGFLAISWIVALVGLIFTALVTAFLFRDVLLGRDSGPAVRSLQGGRYGKAPYRQYRCPITDEFLDSLKQTTDELQEAATAEDWTVDWYEFKRHREAAVAARQANRRTDSLREYCTAISFMMSELRNQRRRKPGDALD